MAEVILPDGHVILVRRRARLKEPVLPDMNATLLLGDREDGVTHLHVMLKPERF